MDRKTASERWVGGVERCTINRMLTAAGRAETIRESIQRIRAFTETNRLIDRASLKRARDTIDNLQTQLNELMLAREVDQ